VKVLVTGASGFVGTHLLQSLYAKGLEIFTHCPEPAVLGTHFDTPVKLPTMHCFPIIGIRIQIIEGWYFKVDSMIASATTS